MKGYNPYNGSSPQQTLFIKRVLNKVKAAISGLQAKLTAGAGISISDANVISANVADVKIGENSIVSSGTAQIPISANGVLGVVLPNYTMGIGVLSTGELRTVMLTNEEILERHNAHTYNDYHVVVNSNLDFAIKEGIVNNALTLSSQDIAKALEWLGFPAFPEESGTYDLVLDTTGSDPVLTWVAQGG